MRRSLFIILLLSPILASGQIVNEIDEPVEWVNALIGTDSKHSLSNGNIYPVSLEFFGG